GCRPGVAPARRRYNVQGNHGLRLEQTLRLKARTISVGAVDFRLDATHQGRFPAELGPDLACRTSIIQSHGGTFQSSGDLDAWCILIRWHHDDDRGNALGRSLQCMLVRHDAGFPYLKSPDAPGRTYPRKWESRRSQ